MQDLSAIPAPSASANSALTPEHKFTATLRARGALPPEGFRALLFNIAGLSYASVFVFFFFGAWQVAALWAADAALCYTVYRWRYAVRVSEDVELTERQLCVRRLHPSGKVETWEFDPHWVRLECRQEDGLSRELSLASHGRKLVFGAFLSNGEKAEFASELSTALGRRRCGG